MRSFIVGSFPGAPFVFVCAASAAIIFFISSFYLHSVTSFLCIPGHVIALVVMFPN